MRVAVETTTVGRIVGPEHPDGPVELVGELDAFDLEALRGVLDAAELFERPVSVDLSGVSFLDAGCARELLSRLARGGLLELRDPSWQAQASFEALGLFRSPDAKGGATR